MSSSGHALRDPLKPGANAVKSSPRGRPSATNPPPVGVQKRYVCNWTFEDERPQCTSSFDRKSDLKRHRCIHSGRKDYHCRMCGKSFVQSSALHVHERTHTGERPHSCGACPKSFADSSSLARHRKTHDPTREVGRRARRKRRPQEGAPEAGVGGGGGGGARGPEDPDEGFDFFQESPASNSSPDNGLAPGHHNGPEDELVGYNDPDGGLSAGPNGPPMFMPPSEAKPRVSSGDELVFPQAPPLQIPAGPMYAPGLSSPADYPMLQTSLPSAFPGQMSAEVSPMDDRRGSGQTDGSAADLLFELAGDSPALSPREKREFKALYGPAAFGQAPTSQPAALAQGPPPGPHPHPHPPPQQQQQPWPNVEIPRSAPSLQTSPMTAVSEMPPTPTDYALLQRPKSGVPAVEQFMRPDIGGPPLDQGLSQRPLVGPHGLPSGPPRSQPAPPQQPQQASPPPPSQVQFYNMPPQPPPPPPQPQQQPPPPQPAAVQWQSPEMDASAPLEYYHASLGRFEPVDAGTVRDMAPNMESFGWSLGGLGGFGFEDDKGPDTFGEPLPSQAFGTY